MSPLLLYVVRAYLYYLSHPQVLRAAGSGFCPQTTFAIINYLCISGAKLVGNPITRISFVVRDSTRTSLNKEHAMSAEEAIIIRIEVIQQPTHLC